MFVCGEQAKAWSTELVIRSGCMSVNIDFHECENFEFYSCTCHFFFSLCIYGCTIKNIIVSMNMFNREIFNLLDFYFKLNWRFCFFSLYHLKLSVLKTPNYIIDIKFLSKEVGN